MRFTTNNCRFDFLELEANNQCRYDYVAVFDGNLINDTKLIGKYCGNQTVQPPVLKSKNNVLTLQFKTDHSISAGGFRAISRFTYGESSGCGGLVNVTDGSKTISSLDANSDGKYELDLNCHWTIVAPEDKIIKLRFTHFDLELRQNNTHQSCWDYVEVRNGEGPFSPQIGVFCGTVAPPDILSHSSFLWLKFFSDDTNSSAGFSAVLSAEDPICGSHVAINATNQTQTLQSPNFGSSYPLGVSCQWLITSPSAYDRLSFRVTDMNLEDSARCQKDKLVFEDIMDRTSSHVTQEAGGAIILSSERRRHEYFQWRMVSSFLLCSSSQIRTIILRTC